jgi:hypothetical protein
MFPFQEPISPVQSGKGNDDTAKEKSFMNKSAGITDSAIL